MGETEKITITLEEYKELLVIKGRYEELKSQQTPYYRPTITWRNDKNEWVDVTPKVSLM